MENYFGILIDLIVFFIALFFLVKSSGIVTDALEAIADSGKVSVFVVTSFLGAIATSLPEFFVSILAAIQGTPEMAVGLLVGANIVNITVAVGTACFIGGEVSVLDKFVKKDSLRSFLVSLLPLILFLDKELSRLDGFLLFLAFLLYYFIFFKENGSYKQSFDFDVDDKGFEVVGRIFHRNDKKYKYKQISWFSLGIFALILSAEVAVKSGQLVAKDLSIPMVMIGLFFLAFGTSLPEIVFGIKACRKKKSGIIFGNLMGSLVSRLTLMLGVTVMIRPISLEMIDPSSYVAMGVYLLSFFVLWIFIKTKLRLVRWEGLVLTVIYIIFVLTQFRLEN